MKRRLAVAAFALLILSYVLFTAAILVSTQIGDDVRLVFIGVLTLVLAAIFGIWSFNAHEPHRNRNDDW